MNRAVIITIVAVSIAVTMGVLAAILAVALRRKAAQGDMNKVEGAVRHIVVFDKPASPWFIPVIVLYCMLSAGLMLPLIGALGLVGRNVGAVFGGFATITLSMVQIMLQSLGRQTAGLLVSDHGVHIFARVRKTWRPTFKRPWRTLSGYRLAKGGVSFEAVEGQPRRSPLFKLHPEQRAEVEAILKKFNCPCIKREVF